MIINMRINRLRAPQGPPRVSPQLAAADDATPSSYDFLHALPLRSLMVNVDVRSCVATLPI
jgi:hypothetical protein